MLYLVSCASRYKDEMLEYRKALKSSDFVKAALILEKSEIKKDQKSLLLWHLEKGTVSLNLDDFDTAIFNFQKSLELIDKLFTTKISSKTASFLINDASDDFYGANYERSFAHYFLAKSLYGRFLKTGNKLDLQGARAAILAWDSYFTELQRSANSSSVYTTDLMLKIFGGVIHEVSEIRNDKQISLQLYKDALEILNSQAGVYSIFNNKFVEYTKSYKSHGKPDHKLFSATSLFQDLKDFFHFKILSLTKELRPSDFDRVAKEMNVSLEVRNRSAFKSGNVVLILEEGYIPPKVGKTFNFGLQGAMNSVESKEAKSFIASFGASFVTAFAMNKLGMVPERYTHPGNFVFAHDMTRLAVREASIEFELPMIEKVQPLKRMEIFVLDENGTTVSHSNLPVISQNADIAKVVLEEDVVSQYIKTGTRVAVKHIVAVIAAMKLYQSLQKNSQSGDLLARSAAIATYLAASKGIAAMEKADVRHWTSLPEAIRMAEFKLKPGKYKLAVGIYDGDKVPESPSKQLGDIVVSKSGKGLFHFKLP